MMTTITSDHTSAPRGGFLSRAEGWLDARGKAAWIVASVLGFIFFWPVGLAFLAYMLWSGRLGSSGSRRSASRMPFVTGMRSTGNAAFDAYKADTLRRLEEEQTNFEAFLKRLRDARDKAEFDQFMEERKRDGANDVEPSKA